MQGAFSGALVSMGFGLPFGATSWRIDISTGSEHVMQCHAKPIPCDIIYVYVYIYIYVYMYIFFLFLHINMFDRRGEGVEVSVHPFGIVGTR